MWPFNLFRKKKPAKEFKRATMQMPPGKNGNKIFELDLKTLEVKETIYKSIIPKDGYWYCAALNMANAEKHFIRMAKEHILRR
jgi:hypothetical protein